jgi:SAM-dependent methyltransferase
MKFARANQRHRQKRAALSEQYGPQELWSIVDHWPLYCSMDNLGRFMALADLLRSTLSVPGHVAEFGSWRGTSLLFLAKLLRLYDPNGSKVVYCFESFEGLTTLNAQDGDRRHLEGRYKSTREALEDMIALHELQDDICIHQGRIEQTLPAVLEAHKALSFSFIFCDVDLYAPTRSLLDHVHTRLVPGGVMVFDEWNHDEFPGEGIAVNEFLQACGGAYSLEHVMYARRPTLAIRKRHM